MSLEQLERKSLQEINQSVKVPKGTSFWRTLLLFSGPGSLVAVGYMDPGNWITSVVGGAHYRYLLLSVVLLSSLIAMQLQQMAGKLGIVHRKDLAQTTATHLPKWLRYMLWIVIELALMATDLAEVIGSGIALHLLFGWPLLFSILVTILYVFLLLGLMHLGFRKIEAIVSTLILTILGIFIHLVVLSKPDIGGIFAGFLPQKEIVGIGLPKGSQALTLALGIIGATVMPHNLYLHSSISQTRKVDYEDPADVRRAVRFMTWDSNIELTLAFVVNSLLLILGAALFFGHAEEIGAFSSMYAVALLASGQNSTITGTLTGQIVMEGFLKFRLPQWLVRLFTRMLALTPVLIVAFLFGDQESVLDDLLVYSQVFLSLALPFSIFPLVYFTSNKKIMGEFVNAKWNTYLAYGVATLLTLLNVQLIVTTLFK